MPPIDNCYQNRFNIYRVINQETYVKQKPHTDICLIFSRLITFLYLPFMYTYIRVHMYIHVYIRKDILIYIINEN